MAATEILEWEGRLDDGARRTCAALRAAIAAHLPEAEGRVWHGHPVWFLARNPIVGYGRLKDCVRLMFWSGQSFQTPGLAPSGSFKAAERRYRPGDDPSGDPLAAWLAEARDVQWDYANIVRRRGRLERLS